MNKEAKRFYKENWQTLRTMGVYQIKNRENGKVFLAASLNLDGTMERDRQGLERGTFINQSLQKDWTHYGAEAFTFEILETLNPTEDPRNYAEEVKILLEAFKEQLEPYGEKGYLSPPRR